MTLWIFLGALGILLLGTAFQSVALLGLGTLMMLFVFALTWKGRD
jgi:hypothetical protein